MSNLKSNVSVPGDKFQWPEFSSERARIKAYSKRFENKSITEAFEEVYGVKLNDALGKANDVPREYRIGDIIKTRIKNTMKNNVEFEDVNFKGTVNCSINLHKYYKLRGGSPELIDAVVTDVKKDRITLDPIKPMTDEWINTTISSPVMQNVLGSPKTIKVKNLQLVEGGFLGKAVIPSTSSS